MPNPRFPPSTRERSARTRLPAPLLAAALLFGTVGTVDAQAAPYRPVDDSVVLERLPVPADAGRRELRDLQATLSGDPSNLTLALRLARRYADLGRAEADPRYYGYAEAALGPWLDLTDPPIEILVLRAVINQSRHEFDTAIADLDRVLMVNPRHAQAELSRAFILQAQGRLVQAQESCRRLPANLEPLIAATCRARVASLSGRAAEAYEHLARASERPTTTNTRLDLWALTNLAEIAERKGDASTAERHYREALALDLRDVYLLGAYADFLLDHGRPDEALGLLVGETVVDGLLLRLTLAEHALGKNEADEHLAVLEARFAAAQRRGDTRHRREEARLTLELLGRPDQALVLALENWQTQKEPADARLVLKAALAADAPRDAEPVLDWIEGSGLQDAGIEPLVARLHAEGG